MAKTHADVTAAEMSVLNVLWDHGTSEIRDIVERIYGQHTPPLHATVKSLLERLATKKLVTCNRERFAHEFSAAIDREMYVGQQLQKLANSHFQGSLAPMLLALVNRVDLNRKDREAIQRVIDDIH